MGLVLGAGGGGNSTGPRLPTLRSPKSAKETKKGTSDRGARRKQERGSGSQAKKAHQAGRLSRGRWWPLMALRASTRGAGRRLKGV